MLRKLFEFRKKNLAMTESDIPKCNKMIRSSSMRRATAHQVVIKQGYLWVLPEMSGMRSSLKRPVKNWVVFGCLNGHMPILDCYSSEETVFAGVPERTINLKDCLCVLSSQKHPSTTECVFTIVLKNFKLSFATILRSSMLEWSATIERHLKKYGIIESIGGENDYVFKQYWSKEFSHEQNSIRQLPSISSHPSSELACLSNRTIHLMDNSSSGSQYILTPQNDNDDADDDDKEDINYYEANLVSNFSERVSGPYTTMLRPDKEVQHSSDDYVEPNTNPVGGFNESNSNNTRQQI